MELADLINELNYKYQFVKNNKYWDYNQAYPLLINGKQISVFENDILLRTAHIIADNTNSNFVQKNSIEDFEIPNIDIEQMKNIVISFFININPKFSDKIAFILSKTKFIKYDDSMPSREQRSFADNSGITLYYKNDLKSLITLAHEISHGIANLDNDCKLNNNDKIDAFSEIESELTEELFLEYLKNSNLKVKNKKSNDAVRELNDGDIEDIKYNKYKSAIYLSYRAIDELEIKKIMRNRNIINIDGQFVEDLSISMNISKEAVISKMNGFINEYYPGNALAHNYSWLTNYDLKNGKHLSNESRFIYAYCFVEKLNKQGLNYAQKCEFYKNYMENAKTLSFQDVLNTFNVSLINPDNFSDAFVSKFRI